MTTLIIPPEMRYLEQVWAACPVCNKHTAGKWARLASGQIQRRPRAHRVADGTPCPGNTQPAILK